MQVATTISIDASPDAVWHVLTDPAALVKDTGIIELQGRPAPGARIKLWSEVAPNRAFALRVTRFEPGRVMVWKGGMPFGLFTGTRSFDLESGGGADHPQTRLTMSEVFSGPFAPMITKPMPDLQPSFDKFARAVKAMSEGAPA
ncbi:MAG: SRPBCC domain-containing protein [Pseudomonadota bacterium]